MGLINPTLPTLGQPNASEDADVLNTLQALLTLANGQLDAANIADGSLTEAELASAMLEKLGLSGGSSTRRGYAEVLTEQSAAGAPGPAPPTDLATPGPSVTVVVPSNGLVMMTFQLDARLMQAAGQWQIWIVEDGVIPLTIRASGSSQTWSTYYTSSASVTSQRQFALPITFPATPGVHTYKLMYAAENGAFASFRNRKLWVWTVGF